MAILQRMCSQDDPDNEARRPRPARIVKSGPSTKGKEPAVAQASGEQGPETSQQPKTADSKSIGELFSPTRPTLGARLSSWSIRQKAQAPSAEATTDKNNDRLLHMRSSEHIRRPATPAHQPESEEEARPTLRTRFSAWSLHQRTSEGVAVLQRTSPSYQAYFPSGRLVVG